VYREARPAGALSGYIRCVWHRRVGDEASAALRVLPDGCMDLMWMPGGLFVAGPDTTAQLSQLPPGAEITALRFRPGAAAPVFRVPALEMVNLRVAAADLWGRPACDLQARLEASRSPAEAARLLQAAVASRLADNAELDALVAQVVVQVQRAGVGPSLRVERLADQYGISERQLHRRCTAALGYGTKTFARIVRFQRFVRMARNEPSNALGDLAALSGYADQAHLNREARLLAGVSPAVLLAELEH
jgi:AraC-like DNA-binding protein